MTALEAIKFIVEIYRYNGIVILDALDLINDVIYEFDNGTTNWPKKIIKDRLLSVE